MATQPWDASGEARTALHAIAKDYGPAALSNPQFMNSMLKDLMPDSPRESSVLVAAAEADVAGILQERAAQHISTPAAVAQAAATLEERTAFAPDACLWAARQIGEALDLPQQTTPEPEPEPRPEPVPAKPPHQPARKPVPAAIVAAWAALVCALSVPLQLLASVPFSAGFSWLLALSGLALFTAALLTFRSQSRYVGAGMIFGAALAATSSSFVVDSFITGFGGSFVAASVLSTLTALTAAGSSAIFFAREARQGQANLRRPLVVAFCVAAIGYTLAFIPGDSQYLTNGSWLTSVGLLGHGVHGRYIFAGLVALVALAIPAVTTGLLASGTGVRAGVVTGWLVVNGAEQLAITLYSGEPGARAAPAFYVTWAFWAIALALGIALVASDRASRVRSAQTPSGLPTI